MILAKQSRQLTQDRVEDALQQLSQILWALILGDRLVANLLVMELAAVFAGGR